MAITISTWTTEGMQVSEQQYAGLVVGQGGEYMGDCDTAYYGVVFDVEKAEFTRVYVGYTPYGIEVDAPADIMAAWEAEQAARTARSQANVMAEAIRRERREAAYEAATPRTGKAVKVVAGRKIAKGTVGIVKVACDGQWGRRVLMTLADGTEAWTAESNVEVIDAAEYALAAG